jgi:hypothetical protein
MDRHDAVHGRSNPEAAADLPADDAGPDEQLRPAAQQPAFYVSQQPQEEGQRATGQTFHQASEQWMELAQKQQKAFQDMSQQWLEQATAQQQAFQQVAQQSLGAYMDLFNPAK